MERPKVTGGDGRFYIPEHRGQDAVPDSVIWGKNQQKSICLKADNFILCPHHMNGWCVLITIIGANLTLFTECILMCFAFCLFVCLIFPVLCRSHYAQLYMPKSALSPEMYAALTHSRPLIPGALDFTRIYFYNSCSY